MHRYKNHLDPRIINNVQSQSQHHPMSQLEDKSTKSQTWTQVEEQQFVAGHRKHGNKWRDISDILGNRPEN